MAKKTIIVKTQREVDEEKAWGGVFFIIGLFIFAGVFGFIFKNFFDKPEMAGAIGFCIAIVLSMFSKTARLLFSALSGLAFVGGILYAFFIMFTQ